MGNSEGGFHSQRIRSAETADAVVTELAAPTARSLPAHGHDEAYFCLVLAGGYVERYGGREHARPPLSITFHPASIEHQDAIGDGGARFLTVSLHRVGVPDLPARHLAASRALTRRATWTALRLYAALDAGAEPLTREALVHELVDTLAPAPVATGTPPWLSRVEERLRSELATPLSLVELAADAGVHPGHVARVCRRVHGRTPGDLRQEARVEAVLAGLARGRDAGDGLAALATDAGFADQAHMTRIFRRLIGTTPGRWRRSLATGPAALAALANRGLQPS